MGVIWVVLNDQFSRTSSGRGPKWKPQDSPTRENGGRELRDWNLTDAMNAFSTFRLFD